MAEQRSELVEGDILLLDFGIPQGHEAGFPRPAVLVSAQEFIDARPSVLHVVPLTTNLTPRLTEVPITAGTSGLSHDSHAQCQHLRAVARSRLSVPIGRVTGMELRQIREVLALILDLA